MSNWKSLQDNNPEPSLLDAITHTEKNKPMSKQYFPNGYGVSVIDTGYGSDDGMYELAVLKGTPGNATLCYTTPITDDVLGWLTEADVDNYIEQVKALPPVGTTT